MARLSIFLFGPFRVTVDGQPVSAFESDKVRALLVYLAVEAGTPHRREKLAGLLWPDWSERRARANLSRALSNLRTAILDREEAPPFLHITRQTLQFNCASDAWVDVTAFSGLLQTYQASGPQTIQPLEHAVALYRGDFLEGFSLPGCPSFEEWALFEGERLRRLALEALGRLSACYEKRDDLERALEHAWRQVELDPLQESADCQVMRLLALGGQRGAALAHYEASRRRLADDLGLEPSAETVALYERIRREIETPSPTQAPPHNLRAPLTPFVGRETELAELGRRLCDPDSRLLTLVGPGGIGKTRLAVQAAMDQLGRYPDGVFQVRLVGLQSAEAIVPTIAEAIGFSFHRQGEPKRQLLTYLRAKTMLLILDNHEHLLDSTGEVVDILRAAPGVTAVITSRTRLDLKGECLFPVEGMAYPPLGHEPSRSERRGEGQDPAEYDAVKLFMSGAHRACPDFRLRDHGSRVAGICRLVEGMPLAILLASAWVGRLAPEEILTRIGQGLDLLESGWQDVPERHRSVRSTIDHSWQLLTERERELFAALSVFRGGFDRKAARQVADASARELRALVDKSFLHRLPEGRYESHELLRQCGAARLDADAAISDAAHDQHCAYYAAALQRWGEALKGHRQMAALAELEANADNARTAWEWAAGRRLVARLDQALEGLCLFYDWRVRYREGNTACRVAAQELGRPRSGFSLHVLARLLTWAGTFSRLLMRADAAARWLQESDDLLDRASQAGRDVRRDRAFLLLQRGHMALHSDREQARQWHEESLALFRAAGDSWREAAALREVGRVNMYLGEYANARQRQEEGLAIRRSLGDRRGIADSLDGLATVTTYTGYLEDAECLVRESLALSRETRNEVDVGLRLGILGMVLAMGGKFDEGNSALGEGVAIFERLEPSWPLAHWSAVLGMVMMWRGQYERALAKSDKALSLSREVSYRRGVGLATWVRGTVALAEEAYPEAHRHLQASAAVFQEIGHREEIPYALAYLACAAQGLGELARARRSACEALRAAVEIRSFVALLIALPGAARVFAEQGEDERAVEL